MIQINKVCGGIFHRVIANKKVNELNKGDLHDVMVAKMSDGRFAVMSKEHTSYFYKVFTEQELHETFTEQFTNLPFYSQSNEA